MRKVRNRIAHHEPIFQNHLAMIGDSIARIAGYVDPAAEVYIRGSERLSAVLDAKQSFVEGRTTSF